MTTAVTLYNDGVSKFPILAESHAAIQEAYDALTMNLGSRKLGINNLQRMKMPSGGATSWAFPTLQGEVPMQEIEVVFVGQGTPRVLWLSKFGEGERGAPPDCTSTDGITGVGLYGANGERGAEGLGGRKRTIPGNCATCPMNQWPARGQANRSKPCNELRNLFFMTAGEDGILPRYVRATPGSLQVVDNFMVALGGQRVPYYAAVLKLGLTRQMNRAGIPYAQIALTFVGKLPAEEAMKMKQIAASVSHLLGSVENIERSEVDGEMPGTIDGSYSVIQ